MVLGNRYWFKITDKKEILVCFLYSRVSFWDLYNQKSKFFWDASAQVVIQLTDEQVATLVKDDPELHTGPNGMMTSSTSY